MADLPVSKCLNCGHRLDAAMGVDVPVVQSPDPGTLSICVRCGAVTAFGDDLRLRPLTAKEVAEIEADPGLMALLLRATGVIQFITAGQN